MDLDVVWNDQLLLRKDVLHLEQRCWVVVGKLINVSSTKCNMLVAQRNSSSVGKSGLGMDPDCDWMPCDALSALPPLFVRYGSPIRKSANPQIRKIKPAD